MNGHWKSDGFVRIPMSIMSETWLNLQRLEASSPYVCSENVTIHILARSGKAGWIRWCYVGW